VTRDDQESRFTRDLYPGYSFTPDNQAFIISYGGKIHRVAVPSGQVADIPFTAKVDQQLGPMVHLPHPGRHRQCAGAPDPQRVAFAGRSAAGVQRARPLVRRGSAQRHAAAADERGREGAGAGVVADGQSLAYVTWTDQGGTLNKIRATPAAGPCA